MKDHITASSQPASAGFSRRRFLASLSAGSLALMVRTSSAAEPIVTLLEDDSSEDLNPDLFVAISPDGTVTITAHRSEMGTGIRTGLPRVVADELEADWNRVVIEQAIGDKRYGSQNTDGSNSVRFFFDRMRIAGATARTMLERAAAATWNVPAAECRGQNHRVVHNKTGRSIDYGDLVPAAKEQKVPTADELRLKPRSEWKYIGRDAPITDLQDIVTGKAVYGIDARMNDQLFAVVARPPVTGGRVQSFDAQSAKKVPGVVDVVEIPAFEGAPHFKPLGGVAVCATSTWAAIQGREALNVTWDDGKNADYDTQTFAHALRQSARQPGNVARQHGDVQAAFERADGDRMVEADYTVPHLSHAPMETPAAVASVKKDQQGNIVSCTLHAATQNPQAVQEAVSAALKIKPEDVICHVTLLGAGFGRKSKPDYCVEAAILSVKTGRPVHVTWTREDDLQNDYFHAVSHIHIKAAVNDQGRPEAWLQRVAYPTILSTFNPSANSPAPFELEMGAQDLPYDIPALQIEGCRADVHTRIGWLRSVCHIQQNFSVSSFVDELAHRAGRDPLEFLLDLLGPDRHIDLKAAGLSNRGASEKDFPYDIGRLKAVTRRCAELADWPRRAGMPKGRGLGIACCRAFLGYTCHVVEVDVSKDGRVVIPNVWCVLDAGTIVSPDRVRAQVEGAAIMAASQALFGKITFRNGRAQQSNFDDYPVATQETAPQTIHVEIVNREAAPAGVGETTVPTFAPALCNSIFAATGKRIRSLPLSDHDLSWA